MVDAKVETVTFPCVNCGETEFTVVFKEDTLHRYACPRCKAVTYAYITKNLELRIFREEELCPTCRGTRKCPDCNGAGKVICPDCKGKGYIIARSVFLVIFAAHYYSGCKRCGGGGESPYLEDIEKGSGRIDRSTCRGTGVCPTCRGFGFARVKE